MTRPRRQQPEEFLLPPALEATLRGELRAASEMPALARQIQLKVDCQQQARLWLASHGGLNFAAYCRRERAREARAARRTASGRNWSLALPPTVLRGLGASLAGAMVGYALLSGIPQPQFAAWLAPVGGLSAALAAVLGVLALGASQWQSLRGLLRAC